MSVFVLALCGLAPAKSWASCSFVPGMSLAQGTMVYNFAGQTINPTVPVGAVMASMTTYNQSGGFTGTLITCTSGYNRSDFIGVGTATNQVYPSNIPGIGLTISVTGVYAGGNIFPTYTLYSNVTQFGIAAGYYTTVKLIKTGSITSGGTLTGEFGQWWITPGDGGPSFQFVSMTFGGGGVPVTPTNPTCQVTTPSISVPLPDTPASAFGGIGTTAGTPQNFSIGLNCSGGSAGTSTKVYVTLTDATNPSNTTDILSPTSATAGTGVGVRIFNGSTAVKYGPDSSTVGNTNQWLVTTVSPGSTTVNIPLTATYVQKGSTVQGGTVSAIATFTIGYN